MNKKASWYVFMGRSHLSFILPGFIAKNLTTSSGRTQKGAFKPGYTSLRNPDVQSDVTNSTIYNIDLSN